MPDISKLNREELEKLKADIDRRMVELEKEQRATALAEAKALAERHGISLSELAELATTGSTSVTPPKYRDPQMPGNTWSGRGRKPKWLIAALEEGAELEDFAI